MARNQSEKAKFQQIANLLATIEGYDHAEVWRESGQWKMRFIKPAGDNDFVESQTWDMRNNLEIAILEAYQSLDGLMFQKDHLVAAQFVYYLLYELNVKIIDGELSELVNAHPMNTLAQMDIWLSEHLDADWYKVASNLLHNSKMNILIDTLSEKGVFVNDDKRREIVNFMNGYCAFLGVPLKKGDKVKLNAHGFKHGSQQLLMSANHRNVFEVTFTEPRMLGMNVRGSLSGFGGVPKVYFDKIEEKK